MIEPSLKSQINSLLSSQAGFAVVRMPGRAPFLLENMAAGNHKLTIVPWLGKPSGTMPVEPPTPIDTYISQLSDIINDLDGTDNKVVLSRVIGAETSSTDWAEAADRLWQQFPDSFGFLIFDSEMGGWLGASPESLIIARPDGWFTTEALAGTMPADGEWDTKNRTEQEIVARYIERKLSNADVEFRRGETVDKFYGNIKHLCTPFSGRINNGHNATELAAELAPTPALAGYPKDLALSKIDSIEKHRRHLYGGYITFVSPEIEASFVAIRCVHFRPGHSNSAVYVGSGITAQSSPQIELQETSDKASALLDIIQSCKKCVN